MAAEWKRPELRSTIGIYTVGIRNAWRMSSDPAARDLTAGDVGQGARDLLVLLSRVKATEGFSRMPQIR